jgi:hypothetical protein
MMDVINLIGAETVQSAGHTMQRAADEMRDAATTLSEALAHHQRWSDDWLLRLAAVLEDDRTMRSQP